MTIQSGTVVWLKSGGPAMTVRGESYNGGVVCTWFEKSKIIEHDFDESQLTTEEPDDDGDID